MTIVDNSESYTRKLLRGQVWKVFAARTCLRARAHTHTATRTRLRERAHTHTHTHTPVTMGSDGCVNQPYYGHPLIARVRSLQRISHTTLYDNYISLSEMKNIEKTFKAMQSLEESHVNLTIEVLWLQLENGCRE